ncbi:MAG: DUF6938 domain-containing protein [Exilispira sp.]
MIDNIFGNNFPENRVKKAILKKKNLEKKFKVASENVELVPVNIKNNVTERFGIKTLINRNAENIEETIEELDKNKGVIIGTIRMGYGHYRLSIAFASAAKALGFTPYWLDFMSIKNSTASKIISHLNSLYSLGSRLSQQIPLFDKLFWEPLNSVGFKKLTYNLDDLHMTELFAPVLKSIPKDFAFVASHGWPAQAAIHAGFSNVVNAIVDNWPMALHLAPGSIHCVQGPSSYYGYRILREMDEKNHILNPIPAKDITLVGHYVDYELVENIEDDCEKRLKRIKEKSPRRALISIGGAGAQKNIILKIIRESIKYIKKDKLTLFVNCGDHLDRKNEIENLLKSFDVSYRKFEGFENAKSFFEEEIENHSKSEIIIFYDKDIFSAVYFTNLLMRYSDFLITKPSELSFYPIPKLFIHRVGGHEAWGAIRSSEIGDGTIECQQDEQVLQALQLLLEEDDLLPLYCENIIKNKKNGIYDGAINVIKIAKGLK